MINMVERQEKRGSSIVTICVVTGAVFGLGLGIVFGIAFGSVAYVLVGCGCGAVMGLAIGESNKNYKEYPSS